jgi:DNA repair protein RecN (Recombination protein N)
MINYLKINNLGLIDEVSIDLHSNLNALTGETGAGKTMVLSAIDALLGKKIPNSLISTEKQTLIEAEIFIDDAGMIDKITELDLMLEENCLIVSRTFTKEGKSKCLMGGRSVPAALLGELMADLIFIHGQKDQIKMSRPNFALAAVDEFIGAKHLLQLKEHIDMYKEMMSLKDQLEEFEKDLASKEQDRAKLQQMIEDIKEVSPQPDEDLTIVNLLSNLHSREKINQALTLISDLSKEEIIDPFNKAAKSLSVIAATNTTFSKINSDLTDALNQLNSVIGDAQRLYLEFSQQDQDIDSLESRRAKLNRIMKLYGPELTDVFKRLEEAESILMKINDPGDYLKKLKEKINDLQNQIASLAAQLTKNRTQAAQELSKLISQELKSLMMADADFIVDHAIAELKSTGVDELEFTFRANPRLAYGPINKIASGGELSRLMLALEVVLSKKRSKQTMIFDEVDTGVGGKAAIEIGKRLKQLSKVAQVILVTHLPQIAAFADQHLVVERASDSSTQAVVKSLDPEHRKIEVSRMLAGLEGSETALGHAEELINLAQAH